MPDTPQFSRRSVVAACNLLANRIHSHGGFDAVMMKVGVEDLLIYGTRQEKANAIARYLIADPGLLNWEGEFVGDALVRKAASQPHSDEVEDFVRALERDGFALNESGYISRMLPEVADLPQADDEVRQLLDELEMGTAKGHLEQAIDNHTRGQWAAANAQLRSFMQELFDEVALRLEPTRAEAVRPGENRRTVLATGERPFLSEALGEWGHNGKNFVNGVFKRLHGEGSHPGLSDGEDCTFRLHLVVVVARLFLRRAKEFNARP